jgi:hypothetical protein
VPDRRDELKLAVDKADGSRTMLKSSDDVALTVNAA